MKKLLFLLFFSHNVVAYNRIVCITLPKSGTHMLTKCVSLIHKYCEDKSKIKPLGYTHLRSNMEVKFLSIMRDPRDRLVSFAYERKFQKRDGDLRKMSVEQILTGLIKDYGGFIDRNIVRNTGWSQFHSLRDLYDDYTTRFREMDIYITTFEKLVGPQGRSGDVKNEQIEEILRIAQHLEIDLSWQTAGRISNELFGGTGTFCAGKIGGWKKEFTQEHRELIKKDIGQLLIDWGYEDDFDW